MIQEFIQSWSLFAATYISGWLVAVILAVVGVFVVGRGQIFHGAAMGQVSMVGIALALTVGLSDRQAIWLSLLMTVAASVATGRFSNRIFGSGQTVTAWLFLLAGSGAILLVAHSPHGLEEIHRLLASSIIGADVRDCYTLALLLTVTLVVVYLKQWKLLLLSVEPMTAEAMGVARRRWELVYTLWLGLIIAITIRIGGTLYVFGCLILPTLCCRLLFREMRRILWCSPLLALAVAAVAFIIANHYDFPPAQMVVAMLSAMLALIWVGQRIWNLRAFRF